MARAVAIIIEDINITGMGNVLRGGVDVEEENYFDQRHCRPRFAIWGYRISFNRHAASRDQGILCVCC
jgi:hypothetical protein